MRDDFLFTLRKIIIITVNRKEFSMKYKEWLDVWFANYIEPSSKTKTCERYSEIIEKRLKVGKGYDITIKMNMNSEQFL